MTAGKGIAGESSSKKGPKVHGAGVTPYGMFLLAEAYHQAGDILDQSTISIAVTDNPIRLLYYHALEGYLRAFLRLKNKEPKEIRAYMHDFGKMYEDCEAAGLVLCQKTADFLRETTDDSDYVRVRYELRLSVPNDREGLGKPGKELPRLIKATEEVQRKTKDAIERAKSCNRTAPEP